ncbi:MAG: CPBP family intramembrane metalloprotease [Phycisphaeraceae bacterium]|nr:CPBP family intramembrane metalloprotease [Phycisphaeraceae bacterium]
MSRELIVLCLLALTSLTLMRVNGVLSPHAFDHSPRRQTRLGLIDLFIGLLLVFVGIYLAQGLLQWFAPHLLAGAETSTLSSDDRVRQMIVIQFCSQGIILPWLISRAAALPDGFHELGLLPRRPLRDIRYGLVAMIAVLPLVGLSQFSMQVIGRLFNQPAPTINHEMLRLIGDSSSTTTVVLLTLSAAVLAPIFEEALFRGLFQSVLVGLFGGRRWPAVLTAALVFSLLHFGQVTWHALPALFILGVTFGWAYERTGSLLTGIVAHMGFNALNLIVATQIQHLSS